MAPQTLDECLSDSESNNESLPSSQQLLHQWGHSLSVRSPLDKTTDADVRKRWNRGSWLAIDFKQAHRRARPSKRLLRRRSERSASVAKWVQPKLYRTNSCSTPQGLQYAATSAMPSPSDGKGPPQLQSYPESPARFDCDMEQDHLKVFRSWTDDQMRELLHRTLRESKKLGDKLRSHVHVTSSGLDERQKSPAQQ